MRHAVAFVVLAYSLTAAATPIEIDPATKAKQNERYFAALGWKVVPLPPLTAKEEKAYDKYVQQLHDQCPAVYERGYVQRGLVKAINAVFQRDQGAILNDKQEKAVLATGADRDHFIAHCEHKAAEVLEECRQEVVHNSIYKSVIPCMRDRMGNRAAADYLFQHCGAHSVDPATGGMKEEGLICTTTLMALKNGE